MSLKKEKTVVLSSVLQRICDTSPSPLHYITILNILHKYCYEKTHLLCHTDGAVTIEVSFVLTRDSDVSVVSFRIYFC